MTYKYCFFLYDSLMNSIWVCMTIALEVQNGIWVSKIKMELEFPNGWWNLSFQKCDGTWVSKSKMELEFPKVWLLSYDQSCLGLNWFFDELYLPLYGNCTWRAKWTLSFQQYDFFIRPKLFALNWFFDELTCLFMAL